jgi:hypothetical protein
MFWFNDYIWIVFQNILITEQGRWKTKEIHSSRNKDIYSEPKEHDYLNFLFVSDLASWAHYKGRDDQDKLATWHEMFLKNSIPHT